MVSQAYSVDAARPTFVSIVNREIKPDRLEYYLDRLQTAAKHSAAEPGLLRCEVFIDRDNPNRITIIDVFADEEAYLFHLEQSYLAAFRAEVSDCTVGQPIQRILQLIGSEKNVMEIKP